MFEPEELGQRKDELAAALRDLRKRAGLTGERLSARCGISQSKISKIERGRVLPSATDVERIASALGLSQRRTADLLALARLANTEFKSVQASLRRGLLHRQRELAALDQSCHHIRYFLPLMLTGLLQTPEYAQASMANFPGDHTQAIAKRLDRQAILRDGSKQFTFLVAEAAARWRLCEPPVMARQMDRLITLSRLPNVRLGLLPLDGYVPDGPLNTFTVYDERVVMAETFGGAIMMRDPRDVTYHRELFAFYERHAVFDDEARKLLGSYAERFRAVLL